MSSNIIGDILKAHRKVAKIDQRQLASLTGVPAVTISNLERGKQQVKEITLMKLLRVVAPELYRQYIILSLESGMSLNKGANRGE